MAGKKYSRKCKKKKHTKTKTKYICTMAEEQFEDTKAIIRNHNSKNKQSQLPKRKRTDV